MFLCFLSRRFIEFMVDVLFVFPIPVTIVLLTAKMSSLVSSGISNNGVLLFSSRAAFHIKQPLVLGVHDVLQKWKLVKICEDLFTCPPFPTNSNDFGLRVVSNFR